MKKKVVTLHLKIKKYRCFRQTLLQYYINRVCTGSSSLILDCWSFLGARYIACAVMRHNSFFASCGLVNKGILVFLDEDQSDKTLVVGNVVVCISGGRSIVSSLGSVSVEVLYYRLRETLFQVFFQIRTLPWTHSVTSRRARPVVMVLDVVGDGCYAYLLLCVQCYCVCQETSIQHLMIIANLQHV